MLGLDTNLTTAAAETGLFAQHGRDDATFDLPVDWDDEMFLPYDWGYFAFVYDKATVQTPPASLRGAGRERSENRDPGPALVDTRVLACFCGWKRPMATRSGEVWSALADNIVTVTQGWSEAYGLFLEGEADMVLSYTTSPAYHLIAEEDDSKAAAAFDEGHYMQIEVAAKVASTDQPDLADAFLAFMLSERFQAIIPTTNWMYPAVTPPIGLPQGFATLIAPDTALFYPPNEAAAIRDEALEKWLTALRR